ncbi:MAG: hypothetical protein M3O68_00740 [Thermoproteota archaeon]|nr:hypothetical protein [Thermoproteota archaeon]
MTRLSDEYKKLDWVVRICDGELTFILYAANDLMVFSIEVPAVDVDQT